MGSDYALALVIAGNNFAGIKFLIKKAFKLLDPILFKLLRNISYHSDSTLKLQFLVSPVV